MNSNQQIEEMAIVINHGIKIGDAPMTIASNLYNECCYRKFADAAGIFVEIHLMLLKILKANDEEYFKAFRQDDERAKIATTSARNAILCAIHSLAEFKKKYTEGNNNEV